MNMFVKEPGAPELREAAKRSESMVSRQQAVYPAHLVDPTTVDGFGDMVTPKADPLRRLPEHTVDL